MAAIPSRACPHSVDLSELMRKGCPFEYCLVGGVTVGVGALLAPASRVKCVTCGTEYRRG